MTWVGDVADDPSTQRIDFTTDVALGTWPGSSGGAPSTYPTIRTYTDGTGSKYYPSQVLSVHDGMLDWYCHQSMGAVVIPFGYGGFLYGTYTVRMRTDNFPGYHVAFLLWPSTNIWSDEVDGPENETTATAPYPAVLQTGPSTSPSGAVRFAPTTRVYAPQSWNDAEMHDYTWVWTPTSLMFYQDSTLVSTITSPDRVPQQNMRATLQVEFSNQLANGVAPDPSYNGHVYVDYVQYSPRTDLSPTGGTPMPLDLSSNLPTNGADVGTWGTKLLALFASIQSFVNGLYTKPSGGIPATDMDLDTQANLDAAANAAPLTPTAANPHNATSTATFVPVPGVEGGIFPYTLKANTCPFTWPTGVVDENGDAAVVAFTLLLTEDSTGGRGITVTNSGVTWNNGTPATVNPTAGATTIIDALSVDGGAHYLASGPVAVTGAVLQSLATTKGDLLAATGAGALARLAVGSDGKILTADSTAAGGVSWQTPASSSSTLARLTWVNNGAQTPAVTTNTTPHDFATDAVTAAWSGSPAGTAGATSFDATFTAPASGNVTVKIRCNPSGSASGTSVKLNLYDVGAAALVANSTQTVRSGTSADPSNGYVAAFTGLTAGTSYTWRLQWALGGTGTASMGMSTTLGPIVIDVQAA